MKTVDIYKKHKELHWENSCTEHSVYSRIRAWWSEKKTIETPSMGQGGSRNYKYKRREEYEKYRKLNKGRSVIYTTYSRRRGKGHSPEECIKHYLPWSKPFYF